MIYQSRPNISEDFKLLSSKVCEYFRIFFEDRKTINIPARPLGSCSVISHPISMKLKEPGNEVAPNQVLQVVLAAIVKMAASAADDRTSYGD